VPTLGSSIEIGNHREGGTYSQDAHGAGNQQHRHHARPVSLHGQDVGNSRMINVWYRRQRLNSYEAHGERSDQDRARANG
jgi:hypothetical protein